LTVTDSLCHGHHGACHGDGSGGHSDRV